MEWPGVADTLRRDNLPRLSCAAGCTRLIWRDRQRRSPPRLSQGFLRLEECLHRAVYRAAERPAIRLDWRRRLRRDAMVTLRLERRERVLGREAKGRLDTDFSATLEPMPRHQRHLDAAHRAAADSARGFVIDDDLASLRRLLNLCR